MRQWNKKEEEIKTDKYALKMGGKTNKICFYTPTIRKIRIFGQNMNLYALTNGVHSVGNFEIHPHLATMQLRSVIPNHAEGTLGQF